MPQDGAAVFIASNYRIRLRLLITILHKSTGKQKRLKIIFIVAFFKISSFQVSHGFANAKMKGLFSYRSPPHLSLIDS